MEEKQISGRKSSAGSKLIIPNSPGKGRNGKKVTYLTNLYEVKVQPKTQVFLYALVYNHDAVPKKIAKMMFETLLKDFGGDFRNVSLACDEMRMMYTNEPLAFKEKDYQLKINGQDWPITLRAVNSVAFSSLVDFAAGKVMDTPQEAAQALEIVLGQFPRMNLTSAGRGYFDGKSVFDISDGAQVWLGYRQSIKIGEGRVYLNVDIANSAFINPVPLTEFISNLENARSFNELVQAKGSLSPETINKANKKLKGLTLEVGYMGGKRTYKCQGLAKKNALEHKFPLGDDADSKEITVAQYFQDKFKIKLSMPRLPLVHVGPKNRNIMLPLELCSIAKGQRITKLTPKQTADVIKIASKKPDERKRMIEASAKSLRDPNAKSSVAASFGASIGTSLVSVDGRILNPPKIQYGGESKESQVLPRGGQWRCEGAYYKPCTLHSWGVVVFERERFLQERDVVGILKAFYDQGTRAGVTFKGRDPPIIYGDTRNPRSIQDAIRDTVDASSKKFRSHPQLLLVFLPPRASSSLYGEIKRFCDTEVDVPTQCMAVDKVKKKQNQYIQNVLLKLNSKVGGVNWILERSSLSFFMNRPAIIFGADVTHPGAGSKMPSIASVVASMDATASRYSTIVSAQGHRVEIIEDLKNIVKNLLIKFYKATGSKKPEKILFYRDGVSESQFDQVLSAEVTAIRQACESLEAGYRPPITFVVVQKRHHVRMFPNSERDGDRSGNIHAGTVVDSVITHPTQFDFYLCSHAGLQGTSRPCHYHVLADENKFTADALQEFTNRLCYTYVRCTKSVSLVPPVYYAHLSAARARFHAPGDMYHDDDSSTSSADFDVNSVKFAPVKPKTDNVMYFV